MAFNINGLSRMGPQGNADALWSFISDDDDYATMSVAGYFDSSWNVFNSGDWIMVRDSSNVHTFTYVIDVSKANKTVTIATGLTVPA